jgi:ribosomal-protein-alanine N-acetyltransferase
MQLDGAIVTPRFVLREFHPNDADKFAAYQNDPDFAIFHHASELGDAHARHVFQLFLDWQRSTPRLNYQFAIAPTSDELSLIGSCGVRMEGCADGEAVFGIELARPYWGRYRYAQEVSEALISWAFDQLGLSALIADTAFENTAVARLTESAGFVRTHAEDKQWWRLDRTNWTGKGK